MNALHRLAACLLFGFALWASSSVKAGGNRKGFLPPDVYKTLVARETSILKKNLESSPTEDKLTRARVAAVMLARFALDADKEAGETAAVQRMALGVAKLLGNNENVAEARKLVGTQMVPGGRPEAFDVKPLIDDVFDLMDHLQVRIKSSSIRRLDLGIDEQIRALAKKELTDDALSNSAKEIMLLGYRTAVVAEVTRDLAPADKREEWRDFSLQMRNASIGLARAAEKKDANGIFRRATSLDAACNKCHDVFR
jgi:hypothetical protein